MSDGQFPSSVLFVIAAILTGIGGYFTRKIQKFEESRDDAHLKILPAIYYLILLFVKSVDTYKEQKNFTEFKTKIDEVVLELSKKISSGEALIIKIDLDKLMTFFWNLQCLKAHLVEIVSNEKRQKELLKSFDEGNANYSDWLKVNPSTLVNDAREINGKIDKKIKGYRSISFFMIILIIIIGVIIGIASYLNTVIESQVHN